jgi:hypothetical protein
MPGCRAFRAALRARARGRRKPALPGPPAPRAAAPLLRPSAPQATPPPPHLPRIWPRPAAGPPPERRLAAPPPRPSPGLGPSLLGRPLLGKKKGESAPDARAARGNACQPMAAACGAAGAQGATRPLTSPRARGARGSEAAGSGRPERAPPPPPAGAPERGSGNALWVHIHTFCAPHCCESTVHARVVTGRGDLAAPRPCCPADRPWRLSVPFHPSHSERGGA